MVGDSADKLRHPRTDAYPEELVPLIKQHVWGGGACLHCYLKYFTRACPQKTEVVFRYSGATR